MVFFTCSHCGESLKKNKVEKHYQTACRGNGVAVTCVDCCKDFNGETFTAHTKCVSEEERYAAKGFTPKPSANKGERKQQKWQDVIKNVKNTRKDLSQNEIQILALLVNQENVPRKRNKFQNYLKTNLHGRYKEEVANRVFDILEEQSKLEEAKEKTDENADKSQQNGETEEKENMSVCENKEGEEEKQLSKKEKKELKKKAKYEAQLKQIENENEAVEENPEEEEEVSKKSKKSKKHKEIAVTENGTEEGGKSKKKNKSAPVENGNDGTEEETKSKKKRKKEAEAVDEDEEPAEKKPKDKEAEEETEETLPKQKFNWEQVILTLLEAKEDKELSLKRLKKKVLAELESCGETNTEKNITKFNKKINKIPGIVVLKDKVKLKACDE